MFRKKGMMYGGYMVALVFGLILGIALIYFGIKYGVIPTSLFSAPAPVVAP